MGQEQSQPSLRLEREQRSRKVKQRSVEKPKEIATFKNIKIKAGNQEIDITVVDDTLTCGWLLSEAIRSYTGSNNLVSLRTSKGLEILDDWLTIFDRSLQPFKDNEKLSAIFEQPTQGEIQLNHFIPLKVIGKGGFSKVVMARKKDTGNLYAIKVMSKEFVIKEEKISQILTERNILAKCFHPFIVKLHWAFQTADNLYLVIDFCPGGELFFHLHNLGRLTEDQAKFYFAEILLGIEYLHEQNIAYRDLKPENVLLDIDGHIRITDFGLSKENIDSRSRSYSFCGSPEYMSPEMLRALGHGREVDFYSIGALLFEMLTGLPPFYDSNRSKIYMKILNEKLELPNFLSRNAKNLLEGLLEKDPTRRFGYENGIEEIRNHPWLKNTDWKRLLQKKIYPPFRPSLTHSNFDPEYTVLPINPEEFNLQPAPFSRPFQDFDYVYEQKTVKEIKLNSVDLASISTSISRTGFFSRNNSHSKISSILEDDDPIKITLEEEKRSKGSVLITGSKKIALSIPDLNNSAIIKKLSDTERTENSIFKHKTTAPKQKVHLVKRNTKRPEG
ncbi:hypothetical protein SteCoe_9606 [Stentor coeruleus]|uniref:Protein kinase domain-containing protein n=1 Tax=Stentor coeruleus TaxID=5963 RepID=A0A1R2CHJ4_9CILI|nr:hypothetical protein SteCoe_9606 [Stentor coeruleus]